MSYSPLHKDVARLLVDEKIRLAEDRAIAEGEVIYDYFKKSNEGKNLPEVDPNDLAHWHSTAIHRGDGSSVSVSSAYKNYTDWSSARGKNAHSWQDFSKNMATMGYNKQHVAGHMRYIGININHAIKEDIESSDDENTPEQVDENFLRLAGKLIGGTAKGTFKAGKFAYNAYKKHQADKTKTYHTVLYSPDNGDTWHYHSHHENPKEADKAHENLSNFVHDDEKDIVHMHLNKDEISQAKANGNHFILHYHAKLMNGGKEPTEKDIKKVAAPPKPPAKITGVTSFNKWHAALKQNKKQHERITNAANPGAPYNDYHAFAKDNDHKPLKAAEFQKHYDKLYPPKKPDPEAVKTVNSKGVTNTIYFDQKKKPVTLG